jgi:hypothetical protein
MRLNEYINQVYKAILFMFGLSLLLDPTSLGEWKAKMDIGYDSIWSEYVYDCDCTEELE